MTTHRPLYDADRNARALLTYLVEPGDRVVGELVAMHGAVAALDHLLGRAQVTDPTPELLDRSLRVTERSRGGHPIITDPERYQQDVWSSNQIDFIVPTDDAWPKQLDDLMFDAPLGLWVRGRTALKVVLGDYPIAVVGARAATNYGEHVALKLAEDLSRFGATVVSGAAYGIDSAAHRAALACGYPTVAVLAGGADRPYPQGHAALIDRIAKTGAVVSEVPPGSTPTKYRFLARNRIIAALSRVSVVVEAGARSGSLNEAAHAASLHRKIAAVPGAITSVASAGTHGLIRDGATLVTSARDIIDLL